MAMKQLAQRLQPLPLYSILGLTVCLFVIELITAHITHSLTLLLDSYHALCNIIVLVGTIITIKHGSGRAEGRLNTPNSSNEELKSLASVHKIQNSVSPPRAEHQLRNTFGWARVDVVVVLIACVFLTSLCFSVILEAALTLGHISHHDAMHHAIPVLGLGVVSLLLNMFAYLLIGGYTFHQGSFLNTDVVLTKQHGVEIEKPAVSGEKGDKSKSGKRQGIWGVCRDCVGSVVVVVCAVLVHITEDQPHVAKFVDPALSILSVVLVLCLSLPFMKGSGLILLQTIPDHINLDSMRSQLVSTFPVVVNVHELHVWKLTGNKTYCTAHIIFLNPKEYSKITDELSSFFLTRGITHITVQPEFVKDANKMDLVSSDTDCLVQCTEDLCMERHCCASRSPSLQSIRVESHTHSHKGSYKEKSSKCSTVSAVATSCVSQLTEASRQTPKEETTGSAVSTNNLSQVTEVSSRRTIIEESTSSVVAANCVSQFAETYSQRTTKDDTLVIVKSVTNLAENGSNV